MYNLSMEEGLTGHRKWGPGTSPDVLIWSSQFHVFISESAITFCESPLFGDPPCEGIIVSPNTDLLTPVLPSR